MANKHSPSFLVFLCLAAALPFLLSGCANLKKIDKLPIPFLKSKEKSSSPKAPPPRLPQSQEPVWIKPVFGKAWVEPRVEANGDYVGGHYVATIIEEGHWATQEEAQRTGRPYLHPDQSSPILPQSSASLPTLPASMENLPIASTTSLQNQLPAYPIPGESPTGLTAAYDVHSNKLILSGKGRTGEKYEVQTPKGRVVLFCDKEEVHVEFHGKTERYSLKEASPIHVRLQP